MVVEIAAQRLRRAAHRRQWPVHLVLVAALVLAAGGFAADFSGQLNAQLTPRANAWSATVAALLAYQGFHVLLHASAVQALASALVVRGLPVWL